MLLLLHRVRNHSHQLYVTGALESSSSAVELVSAGSSATEASGTTAPESTPGNVTTPSADTVEINPETTIVSVSGSDETTEEESTDTIEDSTPVMETDDATAASEGEVTTGTVVTNVHETDTSDDIVTDAAESIGTTAVVTGSGVTEALENTTLDGATQSIQEITSEADDESTAAQSSVTEGEMNNCCVR